MADITPYTNQIRAARYGEEVRGSIVNALEAMNTDINSDTSSARAYATAAAQSAITASNAEANLQAAITAAVETEEAIQAAEAQREIAEEIRQDTETGYVAQCREYAERAETAITQYGVTNFNRRTGNVLPESGDYTAEMVSYGGDGTVKGKFDAVDSLISGNASDISAINSTLTSMQAVEQDDITIPSGWTSGGAGRNFYYRVGKICMIGFDCTPSARVNVATIFTLPTSCCPVKTLRYSLIPGVNRVNEDGGDHYVVINSNGVVTYTGKGRLWQTFTFICNGE